MSTAASASLLPFASPAYAQSQIDFNIPAGDLGSVLARIGRVSGQTIAFPAELTRGRTAGPIVGHLSAAQAVERALAGSGLAAAVGAHGALTVRPRPTGDAAAAAGAGALTTIDVDDAGGVLADRGFLAGNSGSSDRLNIPLRENPRPIVGVTKEVARAQGLTSALEVARNVSNVAIDFGAGQAQGIPSYTIRGNNKQEFLINGQLAPGGVSLPIAEIERVDVIKGSTTDLSSSFLDTGRINLVTKAPTSEPIREATVELGSRFYRTLAFDLGGPVAETEGLTYRLNVSGNTANYARGGDRDPHEGLVSPVVRWQDDATTVTVGARYVDRLVGLPPVTVGDPARGFRPIRIGRDTAIGTPDAYGSFRLFNPYADAEHKLGHLDAGAIGAFDVTLRGSATFFASNYASAGYIGLPIYPGPPGTDANPPPPAVKLVGHNVSFTEHRAVLRSDLIVDHATEYFKQKLRFGIDYGLNDFTQMRSLYYLGFQFDIRNPPQDRPLPTHFRYPTRAYGSSDNVGLSFQDKIDILDALHIQGSVRHDDYAATNTRAGSSKVKKSEADGLSYDVGGVYDVTKWASVFGSLATGFQPQQGLLANGQTPPPMNLTSEEFGLRFNLLDDRFRLSVSRYYATYDSTLIYDPILDGNKTGPGSKVHGYEIDFQGQLTDELQLIGGYGFNRYRPAGYGRDGIFPGIPVFTANLFAMYTFRDGPLKGLSIGAGGHGAPRTHINFGSIANNPTTPGYVTLDATIQYEIENVTLTLSARNLLDHYVYAPTQSADFIPIEPGREILAQARIRF